MQSFFSIALISLSLQVNALSGFILFPFPSPQEDCGCVWVGRVCLATGQQAFFNAESSGSSLSLWSGWRNLVNLIEWQSFFTLYSTINLRQQALWPSHHRQRGFFSTLWKKLFNLIPLDFFLNMSKKGKNFCSLKT